MIEYAELVAALDSWRARKGLPTSGGAVAGAPRTAPPMRPPPGGGRPLTPVAAAPAAARAYTEDAEELVDEVIEDHDEVHEEPVEAVAAAAPVPGSGPTQ